MRSSREQPFAFGGVERHAVAGKPHLAQSVAGREPPHHPDVMRVLGVGEPLGRRGASAGGFLAPSER